MEGGSVAEGSMSMSMLGSSLGHIKEEPAKTGGCVLQPMA